MMCVKHKEDLAWETASSRTPPGGPEDPWSPSFIFNQPEESKLRAQLFPPSSLIPIALLSSLWTSNYPSGGPSCLFILPKLLRTLCYLSAFTLASQFIFALQDTNEE